MLFGVACLEDSASAQGPSRAARSYDVGDGVHLVDRQSNRRPFVWTRVEQRPITTPRDHYGTDFRTVEQLVYAPRTTFEWQAKLKSRWNPFAPPQPTFQLVPHTTWTPILKSVQVPVARHQVVPETRLAQVPVTIVGFQAWPAQSPESLAEIDPLDPYAEISRAATVSRLQARLPSDGWKPVAIATRPNIGKNTKAER